jgi:hypothetical protein
MQLIAEIYIIKASIIHEREFNFTLAEFIIHEDEFAADWTRASIIC